MGSFSIFIWKQCHSPAWWNLKDSHVVPSFGCRRKLQRLQIPPIDVTLEESQTQNTTGISSTPICMHACYACKSIAIIIVPNRLVNQTIICSDPELLGMKILDIDFRLLINKMTTRQFPVCAQLQVRQEDQLCELPERAGERGEV